MLHRQAGQQVGHLALRQSFGLHHQQAADDRGEDRQGRGADCERHGLGEPAAVRGRASIRQAGRRAELVSSAPIWRM